MSRTHTVSTRRHVEIRAVDGFALHGTLFGDASSARGGVLIAPAMGVSQRYYHDLADWLATQGQLVLCFDYRGIGASRRGALRELEADVVTWAERDAGAALRWLDAQLGPAAPITWIGHSLGGQILGLVPGHERVTRMVTVACGSGYWLHNAWKLRLYVWWLWFVVTPIALRVAGYFPGRSLRKVGDLPRGVMAQWRHWCLHRDYLMRDGGPERRERYARIATPILSLSFTDDEYMSARNTESIHGFYSGAPKIMRRIAPRDVGARRIGHFGFFRRRFEATLWPHLTRFMTMETR